ncbi:MAG: class B sortase [Tissierellia bacterium]|nr:class B sortase [Tissierellia bacterium]
MSKKRLVDLLILLVVMGLVYQGGKGLILARDQKKSQKIYQDLRQEASPQEGEKRDLSSLQEEGADIIGWLTSASGRIDYPLVQGGDNETYLHRAASGEKNALGAIFMDYRNQSLKDPLVLVYGHMMKDDAMFGPLKDFKEEGQAEPFRFWTEEGSFEARPKLVSLIPGETVLDPRDYQDGQGKEGVYDFLKERALYEVGPAPGEEEPWILLITCSYEWHNARLAVLMVAEDPKNP